MLLGTRDADEIDDAVRDFARDLDERLATIIPDLDDDPLKLKVSSVVTYHHWAGALIHEVVAGVTDYNAVRLTLNAAASTITVYLPITAPKGSELTNLIVRVLRTHAGAAVSISLIRINNDNTSTNIVNAFAPGTDPAAQDIDLGALTEMFDDGVKFLVAIALTSEAVVAASAALYHVKSTINMAWGS
jgi:hypothetical protein